MSSGEQPIEVFAAPKGNAFMLDIAAWIVEAAHQVGRPASLVADGSLPGESGAQAVRLVVAPHEFYELSDRSIADRHEAAARSVPIATEQPGTGWFERSSSWCRQAPLTLDINPAAVDRLRADGIDARLLRLGAVPSMDARREGSRSIDLTVLAGLTEHRARRLAGMAPTLWPHRCELRLFPTDRPVAARSVSPASVPSWAGPVFGRAKYELLADTRILLNLHRDDTTTYFEWARVVEAMANGCVVVTEPSPAIEPLVDGVHVVVSDDPATAITELLDDHDRLDRIGAAAADVVHGELALAGSLEHALAEIAETPVFDPRRSGSHARSGIPTWGRARGNRAARPPRSAFRPFRDVRRDLLDAVVAERTLRRGIDAVRCQAMHGSAEHVRIVDSPSWAGRNADVSAIVTVFDYAGVVTEALDSLAASTEVDVEIVVVDDHSDDAGRHVVTEWIGSHPDVPTRLVGRDANGGLAAARNLAIEHTRSDRVMILDADNQVYPTCLRRLADALDADPSAAFAWSILEVFGDSSGLLSAYAWDPDLLVERNVVDAQVMLRRSAWAQLGGYRQLAGLLLGWEDWDLWLRMIEHGLHGVLVPEVLGRYRSQGDSMVAGPNRFNDVMLERFEAAHPDLAFPPR